MAKRVKIWPVTLLWPDPNPNRQQLENLDTQGHDPLSSSIIPVTIEEKWRA